ncbi:META domain-containing protein [Joostella sp. CR20]|uniref:META domain-containing protein n=1 Tax=Joostella sp. CR20 TaxID=2804312 RepID=UPI00313C4767
MEKPVDNTTTIPLETDFVATGKNPSWSVHIDFDKQISFSALDEPKQLILPVPEARKPQDVNAVNYSATTENGTLQVTIFRNNCNTSTGKTFGYKVRVRAKTNEMDDYKTFEGCGKYLGDYRLNDIWALVSIDGKEVDKSMKRPNLEFNLRENKVYGFSGCNRINGALSVKNNKTISIGDLISTKMACPNATLESTFMKAVNGKEFSYSFDNLILTLTSEAHTLTFRKVD